MNYYFLAASLPPLSLEAALAPGAGGSTFSSSITLEELFFSLRLNLSSTDFKKISTLRLREDLFNIKALYQKQPLSSRGNFNEKELEEALLVETDLPAYVFTFLGQFEQNSEKLHHFQGLLATYYEEEISSDNGMLRELLSLQKNIRLILMALRAKKEKRNFAQEFAFENKSDFLVQQILEQKEADEYTPPSEFQELKEQLQEASGNPWKQHQIVLTFELNALEELSSARLFSFDYILGYTARFLILEELKTLSSEKGKEILSQYRTRTTMQYGIHS